MGAPGVSARGRDAHRAGVAAEAVDRKTSNRHQTTCVRAAIRRARTRGGLSLSAKVAGFQVDRLH